MNLRNISDQNLMAQTENLVREEQAYRRIAAMRTLKDIPELEHKISSGEITLSHIGLAHSLFRQEKKIQKVEMTSVQKITVINAISNKSVRDAKKITHAISSRPVLLKPDRMRLNCSINFVISPLTLGIRPRRQKLSGKLGRKGRRSRFAQPRRRESPALNPNIKFIGTFLRRRASVVKNAVPLMHWRLTTSTPRLGPAPTSLIIFEFSVETAINAERFAERRSFTEQVAR